MNLQEQINRIKSVMGIIFENLNDINTLLSLGSKGDDVSEIQRELGIYEDGIYGPQTKKCVKDFQRAKPAIDDDGIVGPITLDKIDKFKKGEIEYKTPQYCKVEPSSFKKSKDNKNDTKITKSDDKKSETKITKSDDTKTISTTNIIIGDSQTPYVDMNTSKASRVSTKPGMESLWEGGKTVSWLIEALTKYGVSPDVSNVILCIGTNGGFGKFSNDNLDKLFKLLNTKFPNAKIFAVQGSWGWGGLKNIKQDDVTKYYDKYRNLGATIIEPPIGPIEPHGNKPVYKLIGDKIDSYL
jgi:hypothetical protein